MINPISSAVPTPPVAQTTKAPPPSPKAEAAKAAPAAAVHADTVNISSAAAALSKEMAETPTQTAQEANGGDMQAKRLMAKEAADEK